MIFKKNWQSFDTILPSDFWKTQNVRALHYDIEALVIPDMIAPNFAQILYCDTKYHNTVTSADSQGTNYPLTILTVSLS